MQDKTCYGTKRLKYQILVENVECRAGQQYSEVAGCSELSICGFVTVWSGGTGLTVQSQVYLPARSQWEARPPAQPAPTDNLDANLYKLYTGKCPVQRVL